jgi:putative transport protein
MPSATHFTIEFRRHVVTLLRFLAAQPFVAIFLVLGLGYLLGRMSLGFFSVGSTAGSLLVALLVGGLAFGVGGARFVIPDLVGTIFLALFTFAIGLRVGPQFIEGLRRAGWQLVILVFVTTGASFLIAFYGCRLLGLPPGYAPGLLSGSNTVSAVMGVATSAVDNGLYHPPPGISPEQVKANIAAGYSLAYILSVLSIVLLVRNLPAMFGIDPVAAARESEKKFGAGGTALPGTSQAFDIETLPFDMDVRVCEVVHGHFIGLPAHAVFEQFDTPVLRVIRGGVQLDLHHDPTLQRGDRVAVGGKIGRLLESVDSLGPEIADDSARHFDIDQAEIVVTHNTAVGLTLEQLHHSAPAYGVRVRALFRGGHEIPLLPGTILQRHDVLRIVGPPQCVRRASQSLGQAVRPTNITDVITLGFGIAAGYAVGLLSVSIAGIPVGLGAMGGVVLAGMIISIIRSIDPALGGPMPEGARAFLEGIGVDLFVTTLGLTVAPALLAALSQGWSTVLILLLGIASAVLPTLLSWIVGLYVLKLDPMVLAGAVAGARNSTTAMKAISDKAHSNIPSLGYPVTYALSTVVFLVYGYLAMVLS